MMLDVEDLVARLRAEVDADLNEPLDRLLEEAAEALEWLEDLKEAHRMAAELFQREVQKMACRP